MSERLVVTGGAGFIGSNIVAALNERGQDQVLVVDELGQDEKWKNLVGLRYEDYIDRVLCLPRTAAKTAIRVSSLQVNPALGYDTMKIVAAQPTPEKRMAAEQQLMAKRSPDSVKVDLGRKPEDEDPKDRLEKEKKRLEKTIHMLQARLDQVEQSLSNM